jgi:hypothetical protein
MPSLVAVDYDPFTTTGDFPPASPDVAPALVKGAVNALAEPGRLMMTPPVQPPADSLTDDSGRIGYIRNGQWVPWEQVDPAGARAYAEDQQARANLAPSVALGMLGGGANFAESGALGSAGGAIKAYHGSPHDFDAFDISKIGTGEGAQAYGHGLYFAENPQVAADYRNTLADWKINGGAPDPSDPAHIAAVTLKAHDGNAGNAIADLTNSATNGPAAERPAAMQAIEMIRSGAKLPTATGGRMYEVAINADPEHFLDWDKPVSQQSELVRKALAEKAWADQGATAEDLLHVDVPGEQAYKRMITGQGGTALPGLSRQPQAENATEVLRQAGIPGIRYLDQGSRPPRSLADTQQSIDYYKDMLAKDPGSQFAKDQLAQYQADLDKYHKGTHNYVVFDDKLIDILKKYGMAGVAATGLAGQRLLIPADGDPFANSGGS